MGDSLLSLVNNAKLYGLFPEVLSLSMTAFLKLKEKMQHLGQKLN
jgi:hypothetical protein